MISLDGVMQAAGGPEEGFKYGGWSAPFYNEALDAIVEKQKDPIRDLLLGRKTFEGFASFLMRTVNPLKNKTTPNGSR